MSHIANDIWFENKMELDERQECEVCGDKFYWDGDDRKIECLECKADRGYRLADANYQELASR